MEGSSSTSTDEPLCDGSGLDWELDMDEMLNLVDDFQMKEKRRELRKVRREQKGLEKRLADLRLELSQAHKEIGRKHNEIFKLNEKMKEVTIADKKDTDKVKKQPLPDSKRDPGNSDEYMWRKDAITIFPEEIWEMIFSYLTSTDDLWRLCNTCLLFEDILYKWRTRYLLEQALPYLYPLLPGGKLLECRLVCKSWAEGIDNLLDNHPSLRPYPSDDNDKSKKRDARRLDWVNPMLEKGLGKRDIYFFGQPGTDRRWPLWLNRVGLKPFLHRHVVMVIGTCGRISNVPDPDDLVEAFYEAEFFLVTLGKHIYYLSLHVRADPPTPQVNQRLLHILTYLPQFTPNLRKLRLDAAEYENGVHQTTQDIFFEPYTFNNKLETLEADFPEPYGRNPVLDTLIRRYHPQFRKLSLFSEAWGRVCQLDWSNLTELHLYVHEKRDLEALYGVRMPGLRKLELYLTGLVQFGVEDLVEAINVVASETKLETLMLVGKVREVRFPNRLQPGRHYAPVALKTLKIDFLRQDLSQSLIFVLRCFPFLENLHLLVYDENARVKGRYLKCSEEQPPQLVKFHPFSEIKLENAEVCRGYAAQKPNFGVELEHDLMEVNKYVFVGGMYKSRIWELMPHLKVFSYQWDVYTREGYEEYWRKRGNPRK